MLKSNEFRININLKKTPKKQSEKIKEKQRFNQTLNYRVPRYKIKFLKTIKIKEGNKK
jgi:hypothetical protein